jgi:tRNA (guanine37-N1)-methyltransferase
VIENDIDYEVSIGDYVISGGELASMVLIDAVSRRIDNVLGNKDSLNDSFTVNLLDHPHYTRPESIDGESVPDVLLSGNQAKIDAWRREQAIKKTKQKRPDILSR